MNESEESNVSPRSRNIGTQLIVVSLFLTNFGKCSVVSSFHARFIVSLLSSFICGLFWNILVLTFEMCCSMLLIVSTISDGPTICRSVCHLHTYDEKLDNVV